MTPVTACHTNSYKKLPPIDEFRNWLNNRYVLLTVDQLETVLQYW